MNRCKCSNLIPDGNNICADCQHIKNLLDYYIKIKCYEILYGYKTKPGLSNSTMEIQR